MTNDSAGCRRRDFPDPVLPDHPGGELDDRQCRHHLRAQRAVPDAGRAGSDGAVRRADDRRRALVLRDLVQRRLGVEFGVARDRRRRWLCRPALRRRRWCSPRRRAFLLSEFADLAVYTPLARRRLVAGGGGFERGRAGGRFDRVPVAGLRLARFPRPARSSARPGWCCCRSRWSIYLRRRDEQARPQSRLRMLPCHRARQTAQHHHRHHHDDAAEEGHPALLDGGRDAARFSAASAWSARPSRLRFVPVREDLATPESWRQADFDPRGHRGDAGRLRRGRRRDGRHRRRHFRRHPRACAWSSAACTALVTDGVMRDKPACSRPACRCGAPGRPRRPRSTG